MSNNETKDTGIPTRAIHEAYLNLQQAHRRFRQATDDPAIDTSPHHAAFQDAVLTFHELLRPHVKRKSGMSRFWDGELPDYPPKPWPSFQHAAAHCREHGVAVWACQKHVQIEPQAAVAGANTAVADGSGPLDAWHARLGLGDRQRVVAIEEKEDVLVWIELRAIAGVKQLDRWNTRVTQGRELGNGFMAGQTATAKQFEFVDAGRLTRAKRVLAEAADKMQLLSQIDVDHQDGAIVNFDMSREDAQVGYRNAEYSSSPEI